MTMDQVNIIGKHPQHWTKPEVRQWITWCLDEYSLSLTTHQVDTFAMNGKALLVLAKEDFCDRAPSSGDVLYHSLRRLAQQCSPDPLVKLQPSVWSGTKQPYSQHPNKVPSPLIPDVHPPIPQPSPPCPDAALDWASPREEPPALLDLSAAEQPLSPIHAPTILWHLQNKHTLIHEVAPLVVEHPIVHEVAPLVVERQDSRREDNSDGDLVKPEPCDSPKSFDSESKKVPLKKRSITNSNQSLLVHQRAKLDNTKKTTKRNKQFVAGNNKLLWEFIAELLQEVDRILPVRWLDIATLTFRISDPNLLAEMWGQQKQKTNMTYEKLSRALRYYYRMSIISKVPSKKLTYRFSTPPEKIIKGIRGAKPGVPHKRRKKPKDTAKPEMGKQAELCTPAEGDVLDLSVKRSKKSIRSKRKKLKKSVPAAESPQPQLCSDISSSKDPADQVLSITPETGSVIDGMSVTLESQRYDQQSDLDNYPMTIASDAGRYDANIPDRYDPSGCLDLSINPRIRDSEQQLGDCACTNNKATNNKKPFHSQRSAFSVVKPANGQAVFSMTTNSVAITSSDNMTTLDNYVGNTHDEYVRMALSI